MSTEQLSADNQPESAVIKAQPNGWRIFGIVIITIVLTVAVTYWLVTTWLFPADFKPVVLNTQQQITLEQKMQRLGIRPEGTQQILQPEPYSEANASREIEFSERELNALVARNTDLANKLAIDLSENLVSANLLVDVDPDFPMLGGKTIKVTGGMELRLINGKPSAVFRGISIWGVPLPDAWLGNMRNIDLVQQFGTTGGFWQAINDGIEMIQVDEGRLVIKLKE